MRKKLFCLIALFNLFNIEAQNTQLIDTADYMERKAFLKDFKTKNEIHIKFLKEKYRGTTGKKLAKIYSEFEIYFSKEVEKKNYAFKSDFEQYIYDILSELKQKNDFIPNDLKVLIAKNNTPNAYCLADGTFVINMGLFSILDNRDQIASVITHELGHRILEHNLKNQLKNIAADIVNKKTVIELRTEKYNKSAKAFDLLKKQTYANGIISRKHEIESDSLGYQMFSKGGFEKLEFINALKNLEKYDTILPYEIVLATYKKNFNLPHQEFKDNWLIAEDFSSYNYDLYKDRINKDSISTHPELAERISFLKKHFEELNAEEKTFEGHKEFQRMKQKAKMEVLPNLYNDEKYGMGIYVCLQFLQEGKEEDFYKKWLGKCFQKIYEGRKAYQLNRYLDRIEPKTQNKNYQQYLNFIWNLNLDEIKKIADFYNKSS